MSKEKRFEIFNKDGKWVIKDNEQMPHLLDLYKSCVRLNDFVDKIANLEAKLAEKDKIYVESLIKLEKESEEQLEKQATIHYRHLREKDQEKIEFAVEQILDIKEEVFGTREIGIIFYIPPVQDAFGVIENKIKQLKEIK